MPQIASQRHTYAQDAIAIPVKGRSGSTYFGNGKYDNRGAFGGGFLAVVFYQPYHPYP